MQIFLNWVIASSAIVAVAAAMPSIGIISSEFAVKISLVFGIAAIALPSFLRYVGLPKSILNLIIFNLLLGYSLVFYTSVISPGFYVDGLGAAVRFVVILTAIQVYLGMRPFNVLRAWSWFRTIPWAAVVRLQRFVRLSRAVHE